MPPAVMSMMECYFNKHKDHWYKDKGRNKAEKDCDVTPMALDFLTHTPNYPKKNYDNQLIQTIKYPD